MRYVESEDRLDELASGLAGAELVAADTEAAGYHRYLDHVCLIQVSTRTQTYVIDALAVEHLGEVEQVLADPSVEVVFHDADYDLRLLQRDFGVVTRGLFDTKLAAQFLGLPRFGLGSLVEEYLGVHMEKKYQRADWAQRPLPPEMLEYAAQDTRYLPALRDRLRADLVAKGRLAWAEEEFRLQEQVRWTPTASGDGVYMRMKGIGDFRPRQLAALRELHGWREGMARSRDVAPFRVLANETLIELARRMPTNQGALSEVPGVSPSLQRRHGEAWLEAIERAQAVPARELPRRPRGRGRPPPDPELDATIERLKRARDRAAVDLELDRGFLMARQQLETVARAKPRSLEDVTAVPGIRRWQVQAMGEELWAALAG